MKVLLVGSGGREHAIGWKLATDPRVTELISLPGNPGLATLGSLVEGIEATDAGAVAAFAAAQQVDLVVIGPEAPLAAGLADALQARRIRTFGPSRAAARLESSKAFAKEVMDRARVPTASWAVFEEREPAIAYLGSHHGPYVVKADGLAAGKGVLVTRDRSAAIDWVDGCLSGRFGTAGAQVVIEEYLDGPELSIFAVCDGKDAVLLEPARDYKRLGTGDAGPNTGGMGSYSPVGGLPDGIMEFTLDRVVRPVLATMAADGNPFTGFLYTGYVLTSDGPKVLEFNCRLGDPETQVVLPRLQSSLLDLLEAALDGRLARTGVEWDTRAAVNVVLAADGYPEAPRQGDRITGLDEASDGSGVTVFHAGTAYDANSKVVTAGGRILNVVGIAGDVAGARALAYGAVDQIRFQGKQFRTDIAEEL